ncbi:MAG: hypothetical protein MJY61_00090 [Bacteroidales bacterium]|nr:hypothetical protein [Bacteroidales bacterium]
MKKLIYAAMLLLGLSLLSSCNKENNGSSNSLIGDWELFKFEWQFDNNVVIESYDIETIDETELGMGMARLGFIDDKLVQNGVGLVCTYVYDSKENTLLINGFIKLNIIKLTSDELWLCEPNITAENTVKENELGVYKGKTIYGDSKNINDNVISLWYHNSSNKPIECYRSFHNFHSGDKDFNSWDFYDKNVFYLKRIK